MTQLTKKDIRAAVKAIKDSCKFKGKHPKNWYGYCSACGILKISPQQSKALQSWFKLIS